MIRVAVTSELSLQQNDAITYFTCSRISTLGARDFSSAVSGFCQVFIVTRNTENSRRTREKPLVPRVPYFSTLRTLRASSSKIVHGSVFLQQPPRCS